METVHDIALFAMESHSSPLVTLTPKTYASAIDSDDEWLIDYYAPVSSLLFFVDLLTLNLFYFYFQWCPPCLRLLRELRRLHNYVENIRIGTIDCDQHADICRKANVNA